MKKAAPHPIEREMRRFEAIIGLRHALDDCYQRVREMGACKWQNCLKRELDPSDACVTVQIRSVENQRRALACAGTVRAHRPPGGNPGGRVHRPRFAN